MLSSAARALQQQRGTQAVEAALHTHTRCHRCLQGGTDVPRDINAAGGTRAPLGTGGSKRSPQTWALADSLSSSWLRHG